MFGVVLTALAAKAPITAINMWWEIHDASNKQLEEREHLAKKCSKGVGNVALEVCMGCG